MFPATDDRDRRSIEFNAIRIRLASPETIRRWSRGEVLKPETINYRTYRPEKDGLFCERIFGPVKDWECSCGKYKRIRYKGVVCDKCGVEVTQSRVRRERLGHIELAVPVTHIWYFKASPSRIGLLLDLTIRELERVLYYESYIVLDGGQTELEFKQLITEEEYNELEAEYGPEAFVAEMGAGAIKRLLSNINVEDLAAELRAQIKVETSVQRKKQALKRLRAVEAFRNSGNRPEWMVLTVLPVLPPDLRPLVPLEGGRFATSDLNDLYRRVINRNNRLKKLINLRAPEVILRNEKRMLQEAVDALLDNGRRSRAIMGPRNRPLKSLSDALTGKQGRFRQNLLGKRVDYSGRSVIVVGPELKMHQCGLPKTMALELFKPFIIHKLEKRGLVQTVKSAKRMVERATPEVWDILEDVIRDHPVLLNRAPTLHRLGIQAFEPVLVEGKAIKIHPLVCSAFNADFDGDQMAVHVPLGVEAQIETSVLMLSINNILLPANGAPVASPTHDMVVGINYLSKPRWEAPENPPVVGSPEEALIAYDLGYYKLHDWVKVRWESEVIVTTIGRIILNEAVPKELGFINTPLGKKDISKLVGRAYKVLGIDSTARFLDTLKNLGFHYATKAGLTIGMDDMIVPEEKVEILNDAKRQVEIIMDRYHRGSITDGERYNQVIDTWTRATQEVSAAMMERLEKNNQGFNPVFMMVHSGARGSKDQIRQLAGMRGLMAKPQKKITGQVGEIIEAPITSNFREGLSVLEYFISTHGARKGLADTALKTADAGYLTRRLVDVAQDVIVNEFDCGTIRGLMTGALKEGEEVIEPLADRILGRVALEDVIHPVTDEIIVQAGDEIMENEAEEIDRSGVEEVAIRSVLTCEARRGVCAKCYGRNLATGKMVELGEAVGVIAGQSIGEPGTQLTLRTFHIGGAAARIVADRQLLAKTSGEVSFVGLNTVTDAAKNDIAVSLRGAIIVQDPESNQRSRYMVPYGAAVKVKKGQGVKRGDVVFEWEPFTEPILTDIAGKVKFVDIEKEVTLREEHDERTGKLHHVITDSRERTLHPHIEIFSAEEDAGDQKPLRRYAIPTGAHLHVEDGETVSPGWVLAKIPKEFSKTRDITGGLPRVAELFEARKPKEPAVISEVDGVVSFGKMVRGMRKLVVTTETGDERDYLIPPGKHIKVREGDRVYAGEKLSEGPVNPHDILRVQGANAVQEYLVNEIQEVYRLQGVQINDKHIEVIVRQMLQKVRIEDPGDTPFLEGDQVDKMVLRFENQRVQAEGGRPATFQPLLLGITRAALSTDSFISAASFQETTRVLTEAAIQGKRDELLGLKENVIMGHLIPAGTGMLSYKTIQLEEEQDETGLEKSEDSESDESSWEDAAEDLTG